MMEKMLLLGDLSVFGVVAITRCMYTTSIVGVVERVHIKVLFLPFTIHTISELAAARVKVISGIDALCTLSGTYIAIFKTTLVVLIATFETSGISILATLNTAQVCQTVTGGVPRVTRGAVGQLQVN